ncbi:UbiA family prenyltransferase [Streptomyces sp. PCS3-D2]|uniref:UbiA family prenyltransferase n=1 Tax=Streptomyces sp. PCS3-D2 TaxID=1460244 RepID=UPI00044A2FF1|nr:UbiA family prenyltransferase [Streptomyces sp. PCS3-D2]WKV70237.1 UbiA family prenyltransferase [Streptomyces sp. PCS3-D2]
MPVRTAQSAQRPERPENAEGPGAVGAARALAALAAASHPLPAAAVTLFTAVLAVAAGHGPAGAALAAGAVAAGQLSVGWCNDRADLRRDLVSGRRDKPLVAGRVSAAAVARAAVVALLLCVPLSLAAGGLAGAVHLVGVAAAWGYNLRLKATAASWAPYALAFGLLPAFVTLGLPGGPWPPPWLMAAAALLGAGAHFANVLPDIDDDLATGVLGLPQRLGARRSATVAGLLVLGSTAALVAGPPGQVTAYGWALLGSTAAALLLASRRPAGKLPFLTVMAVAAADVVLLVAELRP